MKRELANFRLSATLVAASALNALGQSAGSPARVDSAIPTPQANFQSAFTGYKPFQEPKLLPWKETLDELPKMSGMEGHAGHAGKDGRAGMVGMDHKGGKADMPGMAGVDHKGGKASMSGMTGMNLKSGKRDMVAMPGMRGSAKEDTTSHGAMSGELAKSEKAQHDGKASIHEAHGALTMARTQTFPIAARPMEIPSGPVSGDGRHLGNRQSQRQGEDDP